jgi:flavin-dependent dehydrogenase
LTERPKGEADVVIVGGGPAGSVCAARLAQRGISVLAFEKQRFPRFHLGESLLPQTLPVLEEIGALPKVDAAFLRKYGARFHDDIGGRKERFTFGGAWKGEPDHAYQVPRDAFDQLLLEHARSLGADVREEWTVSRIVTHGDCATGVEASSKDGETTFFPARFVVDASGRDALRAHSMATTEKIEGLDQTALFAHYENVPRGSGMTEGDIDIVLFADVAGSTRPNWFWFIPFKDGRTSVGAVVSRAFVRDARTDPTAMLEMAIASSTTATELLDGARMLWPSARAAADFSYRVRAQSGPGWIAIGDASGFIDPLFSTGAHIAIVGAKSAADLIADALAGASWDEGRARWEERMRAGVETFVVAVQGFYRGPLVDLLFVQDKHTALRRSVTSLLAGDVFHDSVWLRDARIRLAELANVG